MISERTLRQWRKDALKKVGRIVTDPVLSNAINSRDERILLLTQELMDLHLMRKE